MQKIFIKNLTVFLLLQKNVSRQGWNGFIH